MLSEMQNKLLMMLKWFHNFCVENKLEYYALGGTLLGALRHNGFIPWDDDIDLGMPRKEYEKFIKLMKGKNGMYVLETPFDGNKDFLYSSSKLYDTQTTTIENVKSSTKRGIYIDIFPLDGIGNTIEEAKKNFKKFDRKNMFLISRTCKVSKKRKLYKNVAIVLSNLIPGFIINNKKLSIKVDKIAKKNDFNHCEFVGNLMGSYREKEIFPKSYIGEKHLYKFEDMEIYGFEFADEYLTKIYGQWRQLPPIEKRKGTHEILFVDLNKSYLSK